jgi:hypothetical protein
MSTGGGPRDVPGGLYSDAMRDREIKLGERIGPEAKWLNDFETSRMLEESAEDSAE